MLYDETAVKANVRNRDGKRVFYLGRGDQLTASARDWLTAQRIQILPAEQAKITAYRLLGGGVLTEKPEHMTHLNGDVLVQKTHKRILFRGAMDTLEAEIILCQLASANAAHQLQEVLKLARTVLRCEVLDEKMQDVSLGGLTPDELRHHSHFPQEHYGQPHFMPEYTDGAAVAHLNRCRTAARSAELAAAAAFTDENGVCTRVDILRALNRMSSFLYILMIRQKAGK